MMTDDEREDCIRALYSGVPEKALAVFLLRRLDEAREERDRTIKYIIATCEGALNTSTTALPLRSLHHPPGD